MYILKDIVFEAVNRLVQCYKKQFPESNIFVVKRPIAVYWGHISVLEADLICLDELMKSDQGKKRHLSSMIQSARPTVPPIAIIISTIVFFKWGWMYGRKQVLKYSYHYLPGLGWQSEAQEKKATPTSHIFFISSFTNCNLNNDHGYLFQIGNYFLILLEQNCQ